MLREIQRPRPEGASLAVLKGKISEPITTTSYKPGPDYGKIVSVKLVKEGAGMMGLSDPADNKEWSGIGINHPLLTTRLSICLALEFQKKGYDVNPQDVLNAQLDSHTGRRTWDESSWYKDAIPDAEKVRTVPNEILGLDILTKADIRKEVSNIVAGLAHGYQADHAIYETWNYKLASYADHRISQHIDPLSKRMGEFLMGYFFDKVALTDDLKTKIYQQFEEIVLKGREKQITLEEAVGLTKNLGAKETSERLNLDRFMELVLEDAETEAELIKIGINPDELNDNYPPQPRWERYIRRLYVNDAEKGIFEKLKTLHTELEQSGESDLEKRTQIEQTLKKEFPEDTWWGQYVKKIFAVQNGQPYKSGHGEPIGIDRAIHFFPC